MAIKRKFRWIAEAKQGDEVIIPVNIIKIDSRPWPAGTSFPSIIRECGIYIPEVNDADKLEGATLNIKCVDGLGNPVEEFNIEKIKVTKIDIVDSSYIDDDTPWLYISFKYDDNNCEWTIHQDITSL